MTQKKMEELLSEAAQKYSDKKTPKRPETQFKAGAMWLWRMLTEQHDVVYYEQLLRSEIENRIDTVEPWQESLIHDTAVMMVDRDEMMEEIRETGRLVTKWSKGGDPYQESNPLYVHLKEKERSIGMQREHLGLSFKVNPQRMKESPKKHDPKGDPISDFIEGIR